MQNKKYILISHKKVHRQENYKEHFIDLAIKALNGILHQISLSKYQIDHKQG